MANLRESCQYDVEKLGEAGSGLERGEVLECVVVGGREGAELPDQMYRLSSGIKQWLQRTLGAWL